MYGLRHPSSPINESIVCLACALRLNQIHQFCSVALPLDALRLIIPSRSVGLGEIWWWQGGLGAEIWRGDQDNDSREIIYQRAGRLGAA